MKVIAARAAARTEARKQRHEGAKESAPQLLASPAKRARHNSADFGVLQGHERLRAIETLKKQASRSMHFADELLFTHRVAAVRMDASEARKSQLLNWVHVRATNEAKPLPLRQICQWLLADWKKK